jgi:hypothetical protein
MREDANRITPATIICQQHFNEADSDDIQSDKTLLSLRDPLSHIPLHMPVRGARCRHLQTFDLWTYLSMNEQCPTWTCPICGQHDTLQATGVSKANSVIVDTLPDQRTRVSLPPSSNDGLMICGFVKSLLERVRERGKDVEHVSLDKNGSLLDESQLNDSVRTTVLGKRDRDCCELTEIRDSPAKVAVIDLTADSDEEVIDIPPALPLSQGSALSETRKVVEELDNDGKIVFAFYAGKNLWIVAVNYQARMRKEMAEKFAAIMHDRAAKAPQVAIDNVEGNDMEDVDLSTTPQNATSSETLEVTPHVPSPIPNLVSASTDSVSRNPAITANQVKRTQADNSAMLLVNSTPSAVNGEKVLPTNESSGNIDDGAMSGTPTILEPPHSNDSGARASDSTTTANIAMESIPITSSPVAIPPLAPNSTTDNSAAHGSMVHNHIAKNIGGQNWINTPQEEVHSLLSFANISASAFNQAGDENQGTHSTRRYSPPAFPHVFDLVSPMALIPQEQLSVHHAGNPDDNIPASTNSSGSLKLLAYTSHQVSHMRRPTANGVTSATALPTSPAVCPPMLNGSPAVCPITTSLKISFPDAVSSISHNHPPPPEADSSVTSSQGVSLNPTLDGHDSAAFSETTSSY